MIECVCVGHHDIMDVGGILLDLSLGKVFWCTGLPAAGVVL